MKEIVILMMNVRQVLVVQAVHPILDSILIYNVVHKEELVMEVGVFAQAVTHVVLMKGTVTLMVIAWMGYYVVLTTVLLLLDFHH